MDPLYILCMPVSHPGYVVPGSLKVKCEQCPELVFVAPSSWLIRHDNPGAKIICMKCALSEMESEGGEIMDITPAQLGEIQDYKHSNEN